METPGTIPLPAQVKLLPGQGGLPKLAIQTGRSTAEIYLHGAHVTGFQKNGEPPLLFMSAASRYEVNQPIRGGVPVVFPWFGPRAGQPAHGFARQTLWKLEAATAEKSGDVKVSLRLPETAAPADWRTAQVRFVVTVGDKLMMELTVTNLSPERSLSFENCLHTYFAVGDIAAVTITGLQGAAYIDKVAGAATKPERGAAIAISSEVDRVFLNAAGPVEIHDRQLRRTIVVEKSGSASTVVWNPWMAKSKAMPDFGDEEFKQMVCVESGNIAENQITLPPGKTATMKVLLGTRQEPHAESKM
jgi:D-hexose-6-phosphate mutarotase